MPASPALPAEDGVTHALALGGRDVALELHTLLREFDPAAFKDELSAGLRERLGALSTRLSELLAEDPRDRALRGLHDRLAELKRSLDEQTGRLSERSRNWRTAHRQLQMAYQNLAEGLRTYEVHVPALRPTNYLRNVFHVAGGLTAVALVEFVLAPDTMLWVALAFCTYAWSMEALRRLVPSFNDHVMKYYAKVAHPHEWHRVNSSTWFTTALLLLALTGRPLLCAIACAVLGLADPAAALIGRRFGRTRLVNGRSFEGSTAFFVVAFSAALAIMVGLHDLPWAAAAIASAVAALTAALVELFSRRIDDNLTIPLATAGAAWLAFALMGVAV